MDTPCELSFMMIDRYGYARVYRDGRTRLAHRMAWEDANGAIPEGLCVCHHCDVRNCINVEHLFLGTHGDNARDRQAKGRGRAKHENESGYCVRGHELTPENLQITAGRRRCRVCSHEAGKRWYARKGREQRGVRAPRVTYEDA